MNRGDLVFIVTIVAILILGIVAVIYVSSSEREFRERDAIVQECMKSERYTLDQCVILASGEE